MKCSPVALAFFLAAVCVACSSHSPPPAANTASATDAGSTGAGVPDGAPGAMCDPNGHPDTIAPGLTKQGDQGALTFVLQSADLVPPQPKYNHWTLELVDAGGNPVVDASFPMITTWMPLHMHGSSVAPTWMSNGDGTYEASIYLFMPGLWQVTFKAEAGATADSVTYTFCAGG